MSVLNKLLCFWCFRIETAMAVCFWRTGLLLNTNIITCYTVWRRPQWVLISWTSLSTFLYFHRVWKLCLSPVIENGVFLHLNICKNTEITILIVLQCFVKSVNNNNKKPLKQLQSNCLYKSFQLTISVFPFCIQPSCCCCFNLLWISTYFNVAYS